MDFISLGSGSSGNCYYIRHKGIGIIIDLGIGIRLINKRFRDYGLSFSEVKAILVTHDHTDHVKCVGALSQKLKIPVYATELVHNSMKKNYRLGKKVEDNMTIIVPPKGTFTCQGFSVETFKVPHDSAENIGYSLNIEGNIFTVMTDIGHITNDIKEYVSKSKYLIFESNYDEEMLAQGRYPTYLKNRITGPKGHISNKEAAATIAQNATKNLKSLWLAHLSAENNTPTLANKEMMLAFETSSLEPNIDFKIQVLERKTPSLVQHLF